MQMSPNGDYMAIVSQPRDNKCDIETDLQKYVEDDFRGGRLTLYSTEDVFYSNADIRKRE